ncbi:MAG: fibronectin type III domain-containing protein [Bacteroidota bacterium]|nr:fibronectin type III domain-containing protein [Bacteroidota bacterium]
MKTLSMYLLIFLVILFSNKSTLSQIPHPPSNLHAAPVSSSQIVLHWTDNSNNEETFKIDMKGPHDSVFSFAGHVLHNVTIFNMHHLSPNTTYHFRVAAVNHSGTSHYSNIAGATTFHDSSHHSIPNAPSHLVAHATSSSMISLNWIDNSYNESGFKIEIKGPHDSAFHKAGHTGSNATAFTVNKLHSHTTYSFRVSAFNKIGVSHNSNVASATTHHGHISLNGVDFVLYQNYPNPFNPTTKVTFEIPVSGLVKLKVYDLTGREVADLINEEKEAGFYEEIFNASHLSSGIYIYKLEANNFSETKRMILIK